MPKQFNVEILHHILNYFSENLTRDCSRIIVNILKSLSGPPLKVCQDKKAFATIEVLLTLCEKLREEDKLDETELPIHLIIQSIQHVLQCSAEKCELPDNDVLNNILSIISLLFKNSLLQSNTQSLEELIKVYNHTLMCLCNRGDNKGCKTDCLVFKLKIMNSVYNALNTFAPNKVEIHDGLKLINTLDECKLFGDFVLNENDEIAIQTLIHLIPEYINYTKSDRIFGIIWKLISDSMSDSRINYSRVMIVLCKIFEISFEKSSFKDNKDLARLLLGDSNYWKLVQMSLVDEDTLKRKQGLYLLEKTIDLLNSTCINIDCCEERLIFYWNPSCKDELYKIYSDIIIILQFLDEQQVHIIKPIFGMIETLVKKIIEFGKVSFSWVLLVYKKALMHESTQIVKWGLVSLLNLSDEFFSQEYVTKETVGLLISTLSNMNLYYNDRHVVTDNLSWFYLKIIDLSISKTFFSLFIKHICHQVWSAETLFFVIHSLSEILNRHGVRFPLWGQEEIFELKEFVSKAFKTHNKIIRTAVQCELLQVVSYLTDPGDVPLENLILLISRLSVGEILSFATSARDKFFGWLVEAYPPQEFKNIICKYKRGDLVKEFNEKCMALVIIIDNFFDYLDDDYNGTPLKENYVNEMLSSFREIDKRLYCNRSLQDQYLSIIVHIYKARGNNFNSELAEVRDLILYIQSQLQEISGLQDFNACHFYLNAFEIIIKTLTLFKANNDYVNDLYEKLLKGLEEACMASDTSCIALYYRMKLFSIILELHPIKTKSSFWESYLVAEVNKPLKKDNDYMSQTRDFQTLWGRMNSEFLEGKWRILECLISKDIITPLKIEGTFRISDNDLLKLCVDALNTGGYGILCPVMSILKNLVPVLEDVSKVREIVELVWKVISERRKAEEFKLFIKQFVEMLFQEAFILKGDSAQEILFEYADLIFSDSSLAVVNIFIKHIQQLNLLDTSVTLFCHIIGKGLLFGPIQKKDEKLTNAVCHEIQSLKICEARKIGDFSLSQEIRARAVQKILMLDKNVETHKTAARNLIDTLLKMESEINKNRVRYFGDSHTHRVKHRLMQALLLLEPILDVDEVRFKQAVELSKWLIHCVMNDNSQPSVRYMQEWLLVRMSLRHSKIYSRFCSYKNFCYDEEGSKKSLCSLMVIIFHLCRLVRSDIMEYRISSGLKDILSLCFHQHFEVRLFAQMAFIELYHFAEKRKFNTIVKEFEKIATTLNYLLPRFLKTTKGNFKNMFKLTNDFYLKTFEPLEHYSLETIYMDLPRLTNAGPDERISTATFHYCGVDSYKMSVPLRSINNSLKLDVALESCMNFNSDTSMLPDELKSEENYQKKIIPRKPLIPIWDENDTDQQSAVRKDGLVVVASLIDRIPNLGGLARTCEIFGASEYVISSLKYTQDKQFTSLSVTAEKWISVKEVKTQNLLAYVLEMKQNGYTVIGAEQALHSLPLKEVKFPKKSLLLLGNEKEGIPPNLLPLLDICVEIPQLGIIRSLNVHVTGALFIWEYAKQNLL